MNRYDIHDFFYYRMFPRHRYHIVKTGLEPGYYDTDYRMLHANFQLLVDFIECELAWMEYSMNFEKYGNIGWFKRWRFKRNKEMGLEYLEWKMNLTLGEDPGGSQAAYAKEKFAIYKWWTEERPKNWENLDKQLHEWILIKDADDSIATDYFKAYWEREEKLHQDDEDMLIRLMKIRRGLWT